MATVGDLRRDKGTGTAPRWLDATSRWQARYTGVDGRRHAVYSKTPGLAGARECAKLRDQAIAAATAGVDPTLQPLADYLETYLARRTSLEAASRERYARLIAKHVRAGDRNVVGKEIAGIPLARLRTDDLEDLYRARLRSGAAPKSIELLHTLIHGALAQATARGRLVRNPADGAERPTVRRVAPDVYSKAQLRELVEAAAGTDLGAFVAVLATTGQRLGELIDLRWADVDLDRGRLTIRAPEKGGVPHAVPLAPSVVRALHRQRAAIAETRLRRRGAWEDTGLVFPGRWGERANRQGVTEALQRIAAGAGLPPITARNARHAVATALLEDGIPMKVVQELLGHRTFRQTADTYSHVSEGLLDRVAAAMERAVGE